MADTDGSHLLPLNTSLKENNKAFAKHTDKVVAAYFPEWGVYDRNFPVDKILRQTSTTFFTASFQSVAVTASTTA